MFKGIRFLAREDYRAHCPSNTLGQPPYLVDLEAYNGLGECGCKNFECVVIPNRRSGETDWMKITCRHIRRVYHVWARREMTRQLRAKRERERAMRKGGNGQ